MIDIHSHILPLVDDGANSVKSALDMLDMAYRSGTDALILTPHYAYEYGFNNYSEKILDCFNDFKDIVREVGIPIKLNLGCEFLFSCKESFYEHENDIITLNGTEYLLMEFYFDVDSKTIIESLDIVRNSGKIPVVAHPERYKCIQNDWDTIIKIMRKDVCLQINKGSLSGKHGRYARDTAMELLDNHYVTFIASDAHDLRFRTPIMSDAYEFVVDYYGSKYANLIFFENQKKLLKIKI